MKRNAVVLVTLLIAAVSVASLYLLTNNTLNNNGRWKVSKRALKNPAMCEGVYCETSQALARGHLNLGAWHGFHEVVYSDPVDIRDLSFRFLLSDHSYCSLIYHRDDSVFHGIRLSTDERFPGMQFEATNAGEFLKKSPIPIHLLKPGWHRLHIQVEPSGPGMTLDGAPVPLDPGLWRSFITLGFRGCYQMVLIDDIDGQNVDGTRVRERFFNTRHAAPCAALALLVLGPANFLLLIPMWKKSFTALQQNLVLCFLNLVVAGTALGAFFIVFFSQHKYPTEAYVPQELVQMAQTNSTANIRERARELSPEPKPGAYRIFFLGTSQTKGGGASKLGDEYVGCIGRMLNSPAARTAGITFECLRCGISGGNSGMLCDLYRETLFPLKPHLVVIDLGNNDTDPNALAANLNKIIDMNESRGIKTVIALEPNSIEKWCGDLPNHPVMRSVAQQRHVPCIEAHQFLKQRYDDGFLWWDFVHPTSFGHRLIAECIVNYLAANALIPLASPGGDSGAAGLRASQPTTGPSANP